MLGIQLRAIFGAVCPIIGLNSVIGDINKTHVPSASLKYEVSLNHGSIMIAREQNGQKMLHTEIRAEIDHEVFIIFSFRIEQWHSIMKELELILVNP